jgi:hypothetical protein
MFLDIRNKNMNGLGVGVGISTVFEILGHFLFKGGLPHMVMIYIPSGVPTQESRIHMIWGWKSQWLTLKATIALKLSDIIQKQVLKSCPGAGWGHNSGNCFYMCLYRGHI